MEKTRWKGGSEAERREDIIRLNCNEEITGTNSKDRIRDE